MYGPNERNVRVRTLPARLARLTWMTTIVVASAATTTAKTSAAACSTTTAARTIGLWLGLVDGQRASTHIRAVESGDCFVGLFGVSHFHEAKTTRAAGIAVSDERDFFDGSVRFKSVSDFGFGGAVRQISNIQILHRNSSLSRSSRVVLEDGRRSGSPSGSRGGKGRLRMAWVRALEAERTAEILRDASRMPHRWEKPPRSAESAALTSPEKLWQFVSSVENSSSELGACARYPGFPTRKASCWGGVARRTSSQKRSRWPRPFSMLTRTRSYNAARHQERASAISAAMSTSMPSFRMTSARRSRFAFEVSISKTRFFLASPSGGMGAANCEMSTGVFMPAPTWAQRQVWVALPASEARGYADGGRFSACVPGDIWTCHH